MMKKTWMIVIALLLCAAVAAAAAEPWTCVLTGFRVDFPERDRKYAVYSGPGEGYVRGAKGKASVSTNEWIEVFGTCQGWTLVQYRIDTNKYRIGYIPSQYVPSYLGLQELAFEYTPAKVLAKTALTDDPLGSRGALGTLPAGADVTVLAHMSGWVYVEYRNMRGFILPETIGTEPVYGGEDGRIWANGGSGNGAPGGNGGGSVPGGNGNVAPGGAGNGAAGGNGGGVPGGNSGGADVSGEPQGNQALIDAYMRVVRQYWDKIQAHQEHMEQRELEQIEYEGSVLGTTLYIALVDLTGDGEEELMFLAASDEDTGEPGTIADLYVYTRVGNDAERILFVPGVYTMAGDVDWYRITREAGSAKLYLEYGCYIPGVTEEYLLGPDGKYLRTNRFEAFPPDFEDENDAWEYEINGKKADEQTWRNAVNATAPAHPEILYSTEETTGRLSIRVWEFEGVLLNTYAN